MTVCVDILIEVRIEHGAEFRQVQMAVDAAELVICFERPGGAPAQRHLPASPPLDVLGLFRQISIMDSRTKIKKSRRRAMASLHPPCRDSISPQVTRMGKLPAPHRWRRCVDMLPGRAHTGVYRPKGGIREQPMNVILARPLYWFIAALVVFELWHAPEPMSAVLGAIGHAFLLIGEGIGSFLSALTHKPLH